MSDLSSPGGCRPATAEIDGTGDKKTNTFALQYQLCAVLLLILFISVSPTANIKYRIHRLVVHDNNSTLSQEIESIDLPLQMRLCGISNTSSCEQILRYQQEIFDAGNNATVDNQFAGKSRLDFLLFCLPLQFRDDVQIERWIVGGLTVSVLLIFAAFISSVSLVCLNASQRLAVTRQATLYTVSGMLRDVAALLLVLASLIYPALTRFRCGLYSAEYYVFFSLGLFLVLIARGEGREETRSVPPGTRHLTKEDIVVKL